MLPQPHVHKSGGGGKDCRYSSFFFFFPFYATTRCGGGWWHDPHCHTHNVALFYTHTHTHRPTCAKECSSQVVLAAVGGKRLPGPAQEECLAWCKAAGSIAQISQVAEKALGRKNVVRANDNLPVLDFFGDFVCTAHLRVRHAANDEDNQAGHILHIRSVLVLVPVAIALAASAYTSSVPGHDNTAGSQTLTVETLQGISQNLDFYGSPG